MLLSSSHSNHSDLPRQQEMKHLAWEITSSEFDQLDPLRKATAQLARIKFGSVRNLSKTIDVVLKIDALAYQKTTKITHKYLSLYKLNKTAESDMYDVVYSYQRQLYLTYTQFLDFHLLQSQIEFDTDRINLILARYLNVTFFMAKLRYFDDQPAPTGMWSNVCKVIKCAENLAILNTNLFLYDHKTIETSIATLLKRGFMLDTLQKGNYNRLHIQLTEQVLKVWASNPLIVSGYRHNKFQFFINLESDKGPERIRAVEKFADYRFWKTNRLVDEIESYLCAVKTQKSLLAFGLEKMASTEIIVELFNKLRVDWCGEGYERQRRKDSRNKRNKLINVSYGLEDICHRAEALNPRLDQQPAQKDAHLFELKEAMYHKTKTSPQANIQALGNENWWAIDESRKGLGVDLGKNYSGWVEPGQLIAYTTPEDKKSLIIGEIKSVKKQSNGNYRAGLELLGTHATALQVERLGARRMVEAVTGYYVDDAGQGTQQANVFLALLFGGQDSPAGVSMIVPRREYKRGSKLKIHISGQDKTIEMGVALMRQRDWVRVALIL